MTTTSFSLPGYLIGDQIGRGGFGVVYKATVQATQEPVAIKVLHRELDEAEAARFTAEVQVMGTLAWHPSIVGIRDAGTVGGQPYIVMEYLPRGSLGDVMRTQGRMEWAQVRACAVQAGTALQVAHNNGLLHRDIKPDNILLAADGQARLSDFGVTLAASSAGTLRGTTGTLAYSAPELLQGMGATVASDIYALGATMFALLSGTPAFQRDTDESPAAMIMRAYREPVPDLTEVGVDESAARVVQRAMAKDPAGRPASARDLVEELQTAGQAVGLPLVGVVGAGQAPSAPPAAVSGLPDQPPPQARARAQRITRIAGGLGAVAALLIAVTFISTAGPGGPFGGSADEDNAADVAPDVLPSPTVAGEAPGENAPGDSAPGDSAPDDGAPDQAAPDAEEQPAPPPPPSVAVPNDQAGDGFAPGSVVGVPATPTAIAGNGSLVFVSTATEVVRIQNGDQTSITLGGSTGLAASPDVLAVAADGDGLRLLDTTTLTSLPVEPVQAREVILADGSFWVVGGDAVARVDSDGQATGVASLPGARDIAVGGGVVWASTLQGELLAVDPASGDQTAITVDATVIELAVGPDGTAFLVTRDGSIIVLNRSGDSAVIAGVVGARDVAIDDAGQVFALIDAQIVRVSAGGSTTAVTTSGPVDRLVRSVDRVWAGISTPPAIETVS